MKKYYSIFIFFIFFLSVALIFITFSVLSNDFYKSFHVSNLENISFNNITLIIDPGHGGEDGGAQGNGALEKDINLSVSSYLNKYLMFSSFNTEMTRTTDKLLYNEGEENRKKFYDITNRVRFAESFQNAVFISIHQNKFEIPKYKGLQVYYSKNNPLSHDLAHIIQENARNFADKENKREIKAADSKIRALNSLKIPAVLIECGFLSNESEAKLLNTEEYQKKLAFIFFISTIEFLEQSQS